MQVSSARPLPYTIVIGSSAGGIQALSVILPALPPGFSHTVICVVHLPPNEPSMLPELFSTKCRIPVKEADEKEELQPGVIYFAPSGYHLLVEKNGTFSLSTEAAVQYSKPSIDVLFESAADCFRERLVGILLTGANEDGAFGLKKVKDSGGLTLVQLPSEAIAPSIPTAGIRVADPHHIFSLVQIRDFVLNLDKIKEKRD